MNYNGTRITRASRREGIGNTADRTAAPCLNIGFRHRSLRLAVSPALELPDVGCEAIARSCWPSSNAAAVGNRCCCCKRTALCRGRSAEAVCHRRWARGWRPAERAHCVPLTRRRRLAQDSRPVSPGLLEEAASYHRLGLLRHSTCSFTACSTLVLAGTITAPTTQSR